MIRILLSEEKAKKFEVHMEKDVIN